METNELRRGNLVMNLLLNEVHLIESIDIYAATCGGCHTNRRKIEGIPLTEEWLLKFGMTVQHGTPSNSKLVYADFEAKYQSLRIYLADDSVGMPCTVHIITADWLPKITELKFVHQLQNLYFPLAGEELTIKL